MGIQYLHAYGTGFGICIPTPMVSQLSILPVMKTRRTLTSPSNWEDLD
jgi:hypothetical protein